MPGCSSVLLPVAAVLLLSAVLTVQLGIGLSSTPNGFTTALSDRMQKMERELRGRGAAAVAAPSATAPAAIVAAKIASSASPAKIDEKGTFLVAAPDALQISDVPSLLRLLKSLLGLARLLRRTLVLPASVCACDPSAKTESGKRCAAIADAPFGCPLRAELKAALHIEAWAAGATPNTDLHISSPLKPVHYLSTDALPKDLSRSHVRVLLPDGMSDSETRYALRSYADTRILEM